MLLSTSSAGRSKCLQSQLRHVLLGLGGHTSRTSIAPRSLTSSTRTRQEAALADDAPEQNSQLRILRDDGSRRDRVVGRPGRRQRTSSERLKTTSLGRPAEVVVFRDVADDTSSLQQTVVLREQAEGEQPEVATSIRVPSSELEEVMASIDVLRPNDTILEAEEIKQLKQELTKSYNAEQLKLYLMHQIIPADDAAQPNGTIVSTENDTDVPTTMWQPGRTPIEHRIGRIAHNRNESGKKKAHLAQDIIRKCWQLTTEGEVQQVGELEMYIKSWQTTFLFDLKRGSRQQYETLIESPLLSRSTSIRPFRKDNILRITGRKADVEEVVGLLRAGLSSVRKDELDLKVFEPLLGTPGWVNSIEGVFKRSDLEYISEKTASIFVREDDHRLRIYSAADHPQSSHPKRLLLSLLCLPSTSKTFVYEDGHARAELEHAANPHVKYPDNHTRATEIAPVDIHLKHQRRPWYRDVVPLKNLAAPTVPVTLRTKGPVLAPSSFSARAAAFVDALPKLPPRSARMNVADTDSTWAGIDSSRSWSARLGTLLVSEGHWRERTQSKTVKRDEVVLAQHAALFVDEAGGRIPLLANFEPLQDAQHAAVAGQSSKRGGTQQLLVHLQPSPLTAAGVEPLTSLPPLVLTFDMSSVTDAQGSHAAGPKLHSVHAILAGQEVHMPLPDQAADVSLSRTRSIRYRHEAQSTHLSRPSINGNPIYWLRDTKNERVSQDAELRHLVDELILALKTPGVTLPSLSSIDIPLPLEVLKGANVGDTTSYFISHFEQVTTTDFVPLQSPSRRLAMDPEAHEMAEQWPDNLVLRLREVDAGPLAGRRTEMLLVRNDWTPRGGKTPEPGPGEVEAEVAKEEFSPQNLAKTAVQLAHLMTKGHAGKLRSPYDR